VLARPTVVRRWAVAAAAASLVAWHAPAAVAQVPPGDRSPPASRAAAPPDVVRLKAGGFVRGTLLEAVPGEPVVILLSNGTRRRFEAADVAYAGPDGALSRSPAPADATPPSPRGAPADAPPPRGAPAEPGPRPFATVRTGEARLRLVATRPGVTFHVQSGESRVNGFAFGWLGGHGGWGGAFEGRVSNFARLCTAPCEASLPVGAYRFGLSSGGGKVVEANATAVGDGARLVGDYESRAGARAAGAVVAAVGLLAGVTLLSVPLVQLAFDSSREPSLAPPIVGGALLVVSLPTGLALALLPDVASVRAVEPPPGLVAAPGGRPAGRRAPGGGALTVRF
jgi:hypothetical protein